MTRSEFTKKIVNLLSIMISDGESPILDYGMRSRQEQKMLFDRGLSKCDGIKKLSRHQAGLAEDIYFVIDGQIDFGYSTPKAKELAAKYHRLWQEMGGSQVISWDLPHYEAAA